MKRRYGSGDGGRTTTGLIVLAVGLFLLVRKLGFFIPDWIFSWPMIFIAIGLITLAKHQFRSGFGVFLVLFGGFFLLTNELDIPIRVERYLIPVGLIILGIFLLMTKRKGAWYQFDKWEKPSGSYGPEVSGKGKGVGETFMSDKEYWSEGAGFQEQNEDVINSQALFCGIQKRVMSKNFKGGKVSAIFGGTEIDLTQADLAEGAVLNVEVAFGGVKLLIPPHWELKMGVTNLFAGVEDKRMYPQGGEDTGKVLVINGTVLFGGLEIKSF
ncbi:LiaF transmembrane domain-containing protein [Echinicola sediminis]